MLKRVFKPYGRAYEDAGGNVYPGVTTVLNVLEKGRLVNWQLDMQANAQKEETCRALRGERLLKWSEIIADAKKAADNYRDEKGALGTRIHKVLEKNLNHKDISKELRDDPKLDAIVMQIDRWIKKNKLEPILVEAYLLSKEHGYAGAVDLVARQNVPEYGPEIVLVDFKTGSSIYDTFKWQLAAYCRAYEEMYDETVDIAFLQHIDYENQIIAEEGHMHKQEIAKEFEVFLHAFGVFRGRYEKYL
jgi:CRISPR/Cas system-associated exonuclease Cas4 (RecB family)